MSLFLRVTKKLKRIVSGNADANALLLKDNIIRIGKNCDISKLNVFIVGGEKGRVAIEMGDNCCVRGQLIVYTKHAKIKLGNNVYIGPNTILECAEGIEIGSNVLISLGCNIIDTNAHSMKASERVHDTADWQQGLQAKNWEVVLSKKISIADNCWIGLRSIILKGVELAEGTIVAAGSVVTKNTIAYTVVAGNPAAVVKQVDK